MSYLAHIRFAALIALCYTVTALTGCTQFGTQPVTIMPTIWQVTGKLAVQIDAGNTQQQPRRETLRFSWHQDDRNYQIKLSGSFGVGTTIIERTDTGVTLRRGKSIIGVADNPETLFYQHTGLQLPVSQLQYWITGQPQHTNSHQPPTNFSHGNWHIRYPEVTQINGLTLPKKMTLHSSNHTVTAVFSRWQLHADSVPEAPESSATAMLRR